MGKRYLSAEEQAGEVADTGTATPEERPQADTGRFVFGGAINNPEYAEEHFRESFRSA